MDYRCLRNSYGQGSPKALVLSSDISFPDGNIVLVAGCTAFKVHRGLLERHSEVFRDLFSIPQPVNQSLVDGCPAIELHDHPTDLRHLLLALYDGLYFSNHIVTDVDVVSSVLRLSTKYFIEHLRKCCIARLERDCPTTLAEWDRREETATDGMGRYIPSQVYPHPILILDLALKLDLDAFLPMAFYDLSRYDPSNILAGTRSPPPIFSTDGGSKGQLVRLSDKSLHQIFMGRESAQQYIHTFFETVLREYPPPHCPNVSRSCSESLYFLHLNILRSVGMVGMGRKADPLYTLLQALDMLDRTDFSDGVTTCGLNLCPVCKVDLAEAILRARLDVWELIPQWFGLRQPNALEDMN